MQNLIPKFRQNSIISQKPGCLSKKILTKNFDELQQPHSLIFFT